MKYNIIVPLDGSALAAAALPYAETIARALKAQITLVTAAEPEPHPQEMPAASVDRALDEAESLLDGERLRLEASGLKVRTIADVADPATLISEVAQQGNAGLIVMGTHGRSGPSRWALGSVAERVLRRSHVPILFLTPMAIERTRPSTLHRLVLVPHDGSETSERIFSVLQLLASVLQAPIHLLRAVDPAAYYTVVGLAPYSQPSSDVAQDALRAAAEQLAAVAERWHLAGLTVDSSVDLDEPRHLIIRTASEGGVGWIAMSSHGRKGLTGLVLGSTALAVMRHSPVPILIAPPASIPQPEEKEPAEDEPIAVVTPIA
ncbi:MAG: universal stress protein [Chloroflexi bacterium]|nr:universal stress protein [Chloroflexota bacterium]